MSNDATFPVAESISGADESSVVLDDPVPGRARAITTELVAVALWTLVADLWVFRGQGYLALAAFVGVGWCLLIAVHRFRDGSFHERLEDLNTTDTGPSRARACRRTIVLASVFVVASVLRLGWQGGPLVIASAVVSLMTVSLALSGWLPTIGRIITAILTLPLLGIDRASNYSDASVNTPANPSGSAMLSVVMPVVALIVFGGIFVMANPDLVSSVSNWTSQWVGELVDFFRQMSIWEIPFCVLAFFIGAGLFRPLVSMVHEPMLRLLGTPGSGFASRVTCVAPESPRIASPLYPAFRNTLFAVIVLFVGYLMFEFTTLGKREFPPGFYYAGYAHEGAAWLTVALGLATFTLSVIFNASIYHDPRVGRLKTLAWVWSATNLMLAFAVYHRLSIYVGYNGMTRMRMVGFFGTTLVVVGFVLVIRKIVKQRTFAWLIQVQLVALVVAVILYSLFPIDYLVHRYNASRVAAGYPKPSVMIAVKPLEDEGVFPLLDLVDADDPIIREGVRAKLADRQSLIESYSWDQPWHWHRYQYSKTRLYRELSRHQSKWAGYQTNPTARRKAIKQFESYAMQWY